jgi:1-acyl-sn-glycerol-3-phosphate acyltransferase
VLTPLLRGWFAVRVEGEPPAAGPAILAPNHKSFLDAFFVGLVVPAPVRYMAKTELFARPFGGLLVRLGAFPVRRGEQDADALETAGDILAGGGLVVVFPEGTRVQDPDALGLPHHGAGRLAVATGAPIVPMAIAGTAHLWLGPFPKPRRVVVAFGAPIPPPPADASPEAVRALVDERLWPAVREQYGRLRAAPGAVVTVLAALGVGTGLLVRRRTALPRLIGVVEPLRLRRRSARARWLRRLHLRPRRRC